MEEGPELFSVARNPDAESSLPFLVRLPIEGGVVLKAKQPWPVSNRVYCHRDNTPWPAEPELVEEVSVRHCARRGSAIDLVLDRPTRFRSQFVFTEIKGRPAIFWQTAKAARGARECESPLAGRRDWRRLRSRWILVSATPTGSPAGAWSGRVWRFPRATTRSATAIGW